MFKKIKDKVVCCTYTVLTVNLLAVGAYNQSAFLGTSTRMTVNMSIIHVFDYAITPLLSTSKPQKHMSEGEWRASKLAQLRGMGKYMPHLGHWHKSMPICSVEGVTGVYEILSCNSPPPQFPQCTEPFSTSPLPNL